MAGVWAARFIKSEAFGRDFPGASEFLAEGDLVAEPAFGALVFLAAVFFLLVAADFLAADFLDWEGAEDFRAAGAFLAAGFEVADFLAAAFLVVLADFLAEADFFLVMGAELLNR